MPNLKDQKVGILGLGDENIALVKFLVRLGAKVVIADQKTKEELGEYYHQVKDLPVQFRLGPHYLDHLEDFETLFRTPGLPFFHPKIQAAKKSGVEISSQTKLFFELCPCPIIGVTGTKGKGTTVTLISEILKRKLEMRNGKCENSSTSHISHLTSHIFLGGNIGNPPIDFLEKLTPQDIVVLELSSFQLQDLDKSPHISVILDIKVDHLDYHRDEAEYIEAKRNIVRFQLKDDFAIINADYLTSIEFATLTPAKIYWFSRRKSIDEGVWLSPQKEIILRINDKDIPIAKTSAVLLRGEHNLENISAAILASYLAGADISSIQKVVKDFKGLEHRLEFVKSFQGIHFYNDSFSTTPDTTIAAIRSFKEPIILLCGGSEKNADYKNLGEVISQSSVKTLISIGKTGAKIIAEVKNPQIKKIADTKTMAKAVDLAISLAKEDDVILLSPASASFDNFKNYQDRGEIFKKKVVNL